MARRLLNVNTCPMLALLAMPLVVLGVVAACGGADDGGGSTATGTPTGTETGAPTAEDTVRSMALTLDDLPEGLQDLGGEIISNEKAAEGAADPEAELRRLETWGRELGYSATFILSPDATEANPFLALQSDASLYRDAQGAAFSYRDDVAEAQAADWAGSVPQLSDVQVSYPDAASIGDDVFWVRITGITRDEPKTLFVIDQIVYRTDRMRGFLRVDSQFNADAPRDSGQGQVLQWAELAGERARQALAVSQG